MKNRVTSLLAVLALSASAQAFAQSPSRVAVLVEHTGDDAVGQRFVFELREAIRGSQSMRLVSFRDSSSRVILHIVSQDDDRVNKGVASDIAISIAYDSDELQYLGYLVNTQILTCGINRVQSCARNLLASLDGDLEKLKQEKPAQYMKLAR